MKRVDGIAASNFARSLYAAPNRLPGHRLVKLDLPVASAMRAPGEASGTLGLEAAMDELAEKLGMDPMELRILNEPETDPETGKPFSIRQLVRCMREGAQMFGCQCIIYSTRAVKGDAVPHPRGRNLKKHLDPVLARAGPLHQCSLVQVRVKPACGLFRLVLRKLREAPRKRDAAP